MPARLIESLATTGPLAELFSDKSVLQAMLDFEAALARAEATLQIVPQTAADAIAAEAEADKFDTAALAHATLRAGTPGIPLAKALTERVREVNADAARFVHWGATSQDVADTTLVLLLKRARDIFARELSRLKMALRQVSNEHQHEVMLGRTLMQAAPPITFGLKAAGWLGAIHRSERRLQDAFAEALILQFGGASGTLASLGDRGLEVAQTLAAELDLAAPEAPWHTHRDRLAALLCACGVLSGCLGKMARDISLLMQGEVREAAEPGAEGRGGSSTMPHKRNPVGCAIALAASHRVPGEIAAFLSAMVQEHERGVGGWHAEWPIVAAVVQSTGVAIASMAELAEGLSVDAERMRVNIESTQGVIFAERAMMLLGAKLGRDVAHRLLDEATRTSTAQGRHLVEVLAEMPEITRHLDKETIRQLELPEQYLGVADAFRDRLLSPDKPPGRDSEKEP